jgi:ABC-type antimicrobial peptide transport system ATPase subunit
MDMGLFHSVQSQQIPVEFRFQRVVAQLSVVGQHVDQGMAVGIQTVVAQQSVEIGHGFLRAIGIQPGAAAAKEFTAGLDMKIMSQLGNFRGTEGLVEKEEIRTLEACVIKTPVPADDGPNVGG